MSKEELYFLEYSPSQRCFHIGMAEVLTKQNLAAAKEGRTSDFQVIGTGTIDEVSELADELRENGDLKLKELF